MGRVWVWPRMPILPFPCYFPQLSMAQLKWVKRMAFYNFPKAYSGPHHYEGNISSL